MDSFKGRPSGMPHRAAIGAAGASHLAVPKHQPDMSAKATAKVHPTKVISSLLSAEGLHSML
jgi:hypothetical protein